VIAVVLMLLSNVLCSCLVSWSFAA